MSTWVWASRASSVQQGAISVLAIAETIVATVAIAWLAGNVGPSHMLWTACIAPLFLLRTRVSTLRGIVFFRRFVGALRASLSFVMRWHVVRLLSPLWISLLPISVLVGTLVIKVMSTTLTVFTHPLATIASVPRNWLYHASVVDSLSPRHLIPGLKTNAPISLYACPDFYIGWLVKSSRDSLLQPSNAPWVVVLIGKLGATLLLAIVFAVHLAALLLPSLGYRWAIKGTAWAYLPVIWIARSARPSSTIDRLKEIRYLIINKIAVAAGLLALVLLCARWVLPNAWHEACTWIIRHNPILAQFLQPPDCSATEFPKWQLASGINGLLAIAVFLLADRAVYLHREGRSINEAAWSPILRTVWSIRSTLSIYSITANIYTAASLVDYYGLPKIGGKWFPWS